MPLARLEENTVVSTSHVDDYEPLTIMILYVVGYVRAQGELLLLTQKFHAEQRSQAQLRHIQQYMAAFPDDEYVFGDMVYNTFAGWTKRV